MAEAPEQQHVLLQEEEVVETETKQAAEEQGAETAAGPEPKDAPRQAEVADALDGAGSEEGTGPMVTVHRAKPASVSADEEVRLTLSMHCMRMHLQCSAASLGCSILAARHQH